MKHVSILALYGATMTSIDSSQQILTRVNDFMRYQGRQPFYQVDIVGASETIPVNGGLYSIHVNRKTEDVVSTDVIIVPLLCGDFPKAINDNVVYRDWLRHHYEKGSEIVVLCVGAYFVASTGILNQRQCAVHWASQQEFKSMFPEVVVVDDSILTDEDGIYTCGGGYSYLNLLLYILEKQVGKDTAILASKMFEIDVSRKTQNPFIIFMGQKRHNDTEVLKAQEHIEHHPTDVFTVDTVCDYVGVGRRTFERRFRKSTGNSIMEYIQRVKVEAAKKELETGNKTINEIIDDVGYNNADAFRRIFRRYTDLSLVEYRRRYNG